MPIKKKKTQKTRILNLLNTPISARVIFQGSLTVFIAVIFIYGIVQAGSLTPSTTPAATMYSLSTIYDWLADNLNAPIKGTYDSSAVASDGSGNILERLEFIQQNLGGFVFGSSNAYEVLTTAGGTYNATGLIAGNVRFGVAFATSSVGTYGGDSWTYGSDEAYEVLTIADAIGTYNASNLSLGTVKNGVTFATGTTGAYPSASYPLTNADGTTDLASNGTNITSSNGVVEWWQSEGTRQTATLDFPSISNVCSNDTSNNTTGSFTVSANLIAVGNTYCGTAGTLFQNIFNGTDTGGSYPGGSQANGGVDDFNNAGSAPANRYTLSWTACTIGNDYCGTSDSGADAKDNATGLIWSMLCSGAGCSSFSDASPGSYSWDNTYLDNNGRTASQLCSDHSGWYLPHQKQLMQAYVNGSYGNLSNDNLSYLYVWSATTASDSVTAALRSSLSSGISDTRGKSNQNFIRCVR